MNESQHHMDLLQGISDQFQDILATSGQSIYIYLDDFHKVCNERFASLLGYASADDWSQAKGSFTQLFVDVGSQATLVDAYNCAMDRKVGSAFKIGWKNKTGGVIETSVILVPVSYDGHLFALHYIDG